MKCCSCCSDLKKAQKLIILYTSLFNVFFLSMAILAAAYPPFFESLYYYRYNMVIIKTIFFTSASILLLFNAALYWALVKKNSKLLLTWLLVNTTFWNIHLIYSIYSIVTIVQKFERATQKARNRIIFFGIFHSTWIFSVVIVWRFWLKLERVSNCGTFWNKMVGRETPHTTESEMSNL